MAANAEIERVRDRIDIVELIGGYVSLKKAGRTYKACCPFHQEKTPSFIVFPETHSFHCFGCGQGGDAFTFLMKIEGLEFKDALGRLAARAGVQLTERSGGGPPVDAHRQRLYEATAAAAAFFAHVLRAAAAGAPGRELLGRRGISDESAERFGLGFAPEGWDALRDHLREREIDEAVAVEAGLLTKHDETGGLYDRFRNRLIFPIRDREGRVLGFGGRALGNGQPKYLNSPQSVIFDKGTILYGIDLAAAAIKRADGAVLVEGYVDALMAHQCGYGNVVATMGTALTDSQVNLLKPLTKRLVLALDADTAGRMATLRGIETLRETLAEEVPVVDARRLVRFEGRLSAEIRILTLPVGEDPDSLLRKEPAAWPTLVEHAEPLLDYVVRVALSELDPDEPRAKSALVKRLAPMLREIGDPVVRAHYVDLLGRRLALDYKVVDEAVRQEGKQERPERREPRAGALQEARQAVRSAAAEARAAVSPEDYLLGLLLRYPAVAAELSDRIMPEEFTDARNRLLWERLRQWLPHEAPRAVERLRAELEEPLLDQCERLLERQHGGPERLAAAARAEIAAAHKRLRRQQHERELRYWQETLREMEAGGDGPALAEARRQVAQLVSADRLRDFYPPPSPYFHDIRKRDERP